MSPVAVSVGLLVLAYGLHRLALWLERRGWLYYIHRRPSVSLIAAAGSALDPTIRRILEMKQEEHRLEEDFSGDGSGPDEASPWLTTRRPGGD